MSRGRPYADAKADRLVLLEAELQMNVPALPQGLVDAVAISKDDPLGADSFYDRAEHHRYDRGARHTGRRRSDQATSLAADPRTIRHSFCHHCCHQR